MTNTNQNNDGTKCFVKDCEEVTDQDHYSLCDAHNLEYDGNYPTYETDEEHDFWMKVCDEYDPYHANELLSFIRGAGLKLERISNDPK